MQDIMIEENLVKDGYTKELFQKGLLLEDLDIFI